ncbi:MAG: hypothetical protein VCD00_04435 [Candidatus Hydrogenedentota bacterium]
MDDDSGILDPIRKLYGIDSSEYQTKVHFQSVDHRELKKVLDKIIAEAHSPMMRVVSADKEFIQFSGNEGEIKEVLDILIALENGESVSVPGSEDQIAPIRALFERGQESFELTNRLKNGVTDKIQELAQMFSSNLNGGFGGGFTARPNGGDTVALTIHISESLGWLRVSGPKEKVEEFRTLVEEVDVKPANVELTFYLVMASHENKRSSKYPPAIDSAINQIEKTFQYESFDLLDIIQLRAREGSRVNHSSGFPLSKVNTDEFSYDSLKIAIEVGRVSMYEQSGNDVFDFDVDLIVGMTRAIVTAQSDVNPNSGFQSRNAISRVNVGARMNSSLDVREGQSVVLGKSNFDHSEDALFVIVQAKRVRDDRRPLN